MKTPDFDQIAHATAKPHCDRWDEDGEGNVGMLSANEDDLTADIAEQLRLVWNARGAADIAIVDDELSDRDPESDNAFDSLTSLRDALLTLNR